MRRPARSPAALPAALLSALLLAACAGAPPYQRPTAEVPAQWRAEAPWRTAAPRDDERKGAWWRLFDDPALDALQQRALQHNQSVAAARARLEQARALTRAAGASLLPRLDASARGGRQQPSANRATYSANPGAALAQSEFAFGLAASYELDLFGRVASEQAASTASAQQARAELENTLLVLSADLANLYFGLRATDSEIKVVQQGIALQERALAVQDTRHSSGAASGLDLAQQQALLDATRTQLELLARQRLQIEHALATLVGAPASNFSLAPAPLSSTAGAPPPPAALPSDLLERRPDIAAAERAVAAANAQIGITRAAAFPSIALGAAAGQQSRALSGLFDAPSMLWSFGASLGANLFDGGRNDALQDASRAAHAQAVAAYRQTVLRAFQEVEDGLGGLQALARARLRAEAAVGSAQRVLDIATARYQGGAASYLDVVTAQQNVLNNERLSTQLLGQQLSATAFLAKALGGGQAPERPAGGAN